MERNSTWATAVASVGYLGFFPVAPGTAASAFAVLVYALVVPIQQAAVLVPVTVAVFILGGVATAVVLRASGGLKDPSHVVCDEVAGQWIALVSVGYAGRWEYMLAAFLLFRLFDVWKPPPVSFFDRRPGPWNVMLDDVAAGVYANLTAHICLFLVLG